MFRVHMMQVPLQTRFLVSATAFKEEADTALYVRARYVWDGTMTDSLRHYETLRERKWPRGRSARINALCGSRTVSRKDVRSMDCIPSHWNPSLIKDNDTKTSVCRGLATVAAEGHAECYGEGL